MDARHVPTDFGRKHLSTTARSLSDIATRSQALDGLRTGQGAVGLNFIKAV